MLEYKNKSKLNYENIEEGIKAILKHRKRLSEEILNTTSSLRIKALKRQIQQYEFQLRELLLLGDTEGMDTFESIEFKG